MTEADNIGSRETLRQKRKMQKHRISMPHFMCQGNSVLLNLYANTQSNL